MWTLSLFKEMLWKLPPGAVVKQSAHRFTRLRFSPWVGKSPWSRKWWPTPVFLLGNPMDRGALLVTVHGVTKSWTRLSDRTELNCLVLKLFLTLWYLVDCQASPSVRFPSKNTGVGCRFLLQVIFLTQGSNLHLLCLRQILYPWATWEAMQLLNLGNE